MTMSPLACLAGILVLAAVALLPTTLWMTRAAPATTTIVYVPVAEPTACFGNSGWRI
jgi:hypothetical protein